MEPEWEVETDRKTLLRIMASLAAMAGFVTSPLRGEVGTQSVPGGGESPVGRRQIGSSSGASKGLERLELERRAGGTQSVPGGGESPVCRRQIGSSSGASKGLERPELERRAGGTQSVPGGGAAPSVEGHTIPRFLYRTILKLLRPAEYAARRIVIAFSRDIRLPPPKPHPPKPLPVLRDGFGNPIVLPDGFRISGHLHRTSGTSFRRSGSSGAAASGSPKAPRRLSLPLFDPLPKFGRSFSLRTAQPRIWVTGATDRRPVPPRPHRNDPVDAGRLWQRIDAVVAALTDVDAHARRYARWRDRTRRALAEGKPCKRLQPLDTARLPTGGSGLRRELHDVLKSTHRFAWYAVNYPDDS